MTPRTAFIGFLRASPKARAKRQRAIDRAADWLFYDAQVKKFGPYLHPSVYERKKAKQ